MIAMGRFIQVVQLWSPSLHDLFVSYLRHDSEFAERLTLALSEAGWVVWLDKRGIRDGDHYDRQIEEAIASTKAVLVLWSVRSIDSEWVRAEAAYALSKQKLVPVRIDAVEPPLQFLHVQTIDLRSQDCDVESLEFKKLRAGLERRLGTPAQSADRKSTRLNSSHLKLSRMPSSA